MSVASGYRVTDEMLTKRLLAKYIPEPMSGCWLWEGAHRKNEYGTMWNGKAHENSHRLSYRLLVGPIPDGLWVLHRCDNPACINPDHLFVGTQSDNLKDCVRKGRHHPASLKGIANHKAKLTEAQVLEIRQIPRVMGALAKAAKIYGVPRERLCAIRNGRGWKHLK